MSHLQGSGRATVWPGVLIQVGGGLAAALRQTTLLGARSQPTRRPPQYSAD